ncbi:hypothetical protein BST30_22150 [Mycobacterium mantenii]|uniref:Uncharacterized protein n=1 Tax=Mycobacterium mantenii TaxID=560555 RepID=A0A1X0FHC7_MYCNT|nr:hypothetical protein BST30_22150 [Mycobacterium mantenii]
MRGPSRTRQPVHRFAQAPNCVAALSAEQTRQDSWRAIEVIASTHNRRVESYLQRRRHRPWRNRGS